MIHLAVSPAQTGTLSTPSGACAVGFGKRPIAIKLTNNSIKMLDSVTNEPMQQSEFTMVRNQKSNPSNPSKPSSNDATATARVHTHRHHRHPRPRACHPAMSCGCYCRPSPRPFSTPSVPPQPP